MNEFGQQAGQFIHNIFGDRAHHAARQQQHRPSSQQQRQQPATIPPASQQVRRQLPNIRVTPEDLVEVCNRECCICTDTIQVQDIQTRLPCAHLFHPNCIQDWLVRSCMCPICRYELPTDDSTFEAGRLERMRHRKPRFARHELLKLGISQLKAYAKGSRIPRSVLDKNGLIQYLVSTDCIELIPGDFAPVQHRLSELRTSSIKRLRETMNEAGVFFDRKDIVEKEDMVKIFINSGRLEIVPEQVEQPEVETVHSEDEDEAIHNTHDNVTRRDTRLNEGLVMEEAAENEVLSETTRINADHLTSQINHGEESLSVNESPHPVVTDTSHSRVPAQVPLDNQRSTGRLETLTAQVALLDTQELASLQETIAQLLEDRNHLRS